ncbi:MAG: tetratricopeptide repeat protein [bacterium]|nr:tetratricopeptide repeat protein [bacterium]
MSRPVRPSLRAGPLVFLLAATSAVGCARLGGEATLADLEGRQPDLEEVEVGDGLAQAMEGYRQFLAEAPESSLTPEAMRRLADLALEKSYGSLGARATRGTSEPSGASLPVPAAAAPTPRREARTTKRAPRETEAQLESRTFAAQPLAYEELDPAEIDPSVRAEDTAGPAEAIALYDRILARYPDYPYLDQVLYQKARALDELGRVDEAVAVADRLIAERPGSRHLDELLFRRGEYHFVRRRFFDAESSYSSIVELGPASDYYELALYKLGWSLYKQMLLEEALHSYVMLLDHKVATDYDFDQVEDEAEAQRVADTFRVLSLCFSELGGPEVITQFFDGQGSRPYEHRVYRELGEFFLDKLRYADAAQTYQAFTARYPNHAMAPRFGMRIVEIYEAGDFPRLVLEAKRDFAESYGVSSPYWEHHDIEAATETLAHLETNLRDLATHAHALYQEDDEAPRRPEHFAEASRWYRTYLVSFPENPATPGLHRRFADLLLEDQRFTEAAEAFETVAYGYPAHDEATDAGYAAVFARREAHAGTNPEESEPALRAVVGTSLQFATTFPADERAVLVLGAAADDLYTLGDHAEAIRHATRLVEDYPDTEQKTLRGAWLTIAHASFDSELFEEAERAYLRVTELALPEDEDVTDNLAAAVYKQGEIAKVAGDSKAAADHFLRIAAVAPDSTIRPMAEYDAAAALIALEDWGAAAGVLEAFRVDHPDHVLQRDVTRQMAFVRRSEGDLSSAAVEYVRVADGAETSEERAEALTTAAALHEDAGELRRALDILRVLVTEYTDPLERLVVTRFKMAEIHGKLKESRERSEALRHVVALDAKAGSDRTPVVRGLAAKAALELVEPGFDRYAVIELDQPFDRSLARKKRSLEQVVADFEALVDYGVGDVTAAATFYIAEAYGEFGRALVESERPADLSGGDRLDYDDMLEEQAFPFEERTISLHEKNLELARTGLANAWIERSLSRLAEVSPGRYAKQEMSTGPLESLDGYVYRTPLREAVPTPTEAEAEEPAVLAEVEAPTEDELVTPGDEAASPDVAPAPPAAIAPASGAPSTASVEETSEEVER